MQSLTPPKQRAAKGLSSRQRLDDRVVAEGLAPSRSRAAALVLSGKVLVDGQRCDKAGTLVKATAAVTLKAPDHPWVSRGGLKLAHALEAFSLNPEGWVAADIGASTGGFTHVLLHHCAQKVYAVDVGHGQLDWTLRQDARVQVLEKTNARFLTSTHIPDVLDAVVCDASFIGLRTVLGAVLGLLRPGGVLVALIKPQFEAGRKDVGKGGVVRDETVHARVCHEIQAWLEGLDWTLLGLVASPVLGPEGNREFLIAARKPAPSD